MKYNVTSPTALQILERGRVNLPEHLSPPKLYTRAAHQLNRLHKNYRSHGDINLSNFKVDEATGTVNLINFMKCQEAFYVSPEYEVLMKPIVKEENKKVWRLFSAYMSNDEIEEIKREEEEKKKEDRLAEY